MAIVLPTNADTTLYAYVSGIGSPSTASPRVGGTTDSSTTIPTTDLDDGDMLLFLITRDDNDGTITAPTGLTGVTAPTAGSGTYDEFFQVNDAGGDDAAIAGFYTEVTDVSAMSSSEAHGFPLGTGEEYIGVLIVVKGADTTTFEDLAWNETNHFVSSQNSNGPTPQPITTATDGAVVIIFSGCRNNARYLGAEEVTFAWKFLAPSGYTLEQAATGVDDDGNTMANVPSGAPSVLQQGVGNGDAQMGWAWKEVGTAGTETPGAFAGLQNTRDQKVATFAIRPASGGPVETSGTISGGGGLAATVEATHEASDTVSGGGGLAATAEHKGSTSGTINGGGSIAATVIHLEHASTSGTISGGGSLAATVTTTHESADTISGGGSLTAAIEHAGSVAGTIRGGGSITPTVAGFHESAGTISGGGSITAAVTGKLATNLLPLFASMIGD